MKQATEELYFCSSYNPIDSADRNQACAEIRQVCKAMDQKLIPVSMLDTFKQSLQDAIIKINARHKRCKDIGLTQIGTWDSKAVRLLIGGLLGRMELKKVTPFTNCKELSDD